MEPAHAGLVDESIAADRHTGQERPARSGTGTPACAVGDGRPTHPLQGDDPEHDERDAEGAERRRPFVEENHGEDRHQRDAETARHRIDERELARAVRAPERDEVERVQQDRRDDERPRAGGHAPGRQRRERHREKEHGSDGQRRAEERELVLRPLGQRVPARVKDRGGEHERERRRRHQPPAEPPAPEIGRVTEREYQPGIDAE